jgi:hypothetical protein
MRPPRLSQARWSTIVDHSFWSIADHLRHARVERPMFSAALLCAARTATGTSIAQGTPVIADRGNRRCGRFVEQVAGRFAGEERFLDGVQGEWLADEVKLANLIALRAANAAEGAYGE